jgi:6-pyruvoyltetrahydropterin/6-carboxytetrahydropterin synthase
MKVAKRFRWEAAHRLPWHEGDCRFIHGHSYRMMVEVEGEPTEDTPGGGSMLIDFKHVKRLVKPLVEQMDHATIVSSTDSDLKEALSAIDSKVYEMDADSTAENLSEHVAGHIVTEGWELLKKHGIETVRVKVWETETCYSEAEKVIRKQVDPASNLDDVSTEPLGA